MLGLLEDVRLASGYAELGLSLALLSVIVDAHSLVLIVALAAIVVGGSVIWGETLLEGSVGFLHFHKLQGPLADVCEALGVSDHVGAVVSLARICVVVAIEGVEL